MTLRVFDSVPERRVGRDGVEIAYWVHGNGVPLLLLTGLATPAASWHVLPAILAEQGYRAVAVDNRDCGRSSRCDGIDYSIADMAGDAAAVLDDLGIDQAYVFAISMGGLIGQEFALGHPERVRGLILVATGPGTRGGVHPDPGVVRDIFDFRVSGDLRSDMAALLGRLMGPGFAETNRALVERLAAIRVEQGSDGFALTRQWQAITSFDSWDRLPSLRVPTLILHGEADPLVPFENGVRLAECIQGAELIALPGVGHFVPLEAPAETLAAIARFFPVEAKAEAG